MTRARILACAGFLAAFILLSILHEAGHIAMGFLSGAPIWEATVFHRRVFPPDFGRVEIPALYSITYGAADDPIALGLRAAGGCAATLLAGIVGILWRRLRRPTHPAADGFSLCLSLAGLDFVTYAWLPALGLPHWLIFGARHSEPAEAASHLGLSPVLLHIGVLAVLIATIGIPLRKRKSP